MADSNMTIGSVTARSGKSRMRKVTFTQTAAGAAGNATTTFPITGKLLRYVTTGGDASWDFTLNDGTANIFASGNLTATATSGVLNMHATIPHDGIPMAGQTLLCTIANSATNIVTITIIWEESS
jgi:hypothetical protein